MLLHRVFGLAAKAQITPAFATADQLLIQVAALFLPLGTAFTGRGRETC
ncbi:hypothetical protein [Bordetella petrii]